MSFLDHGYQKFDGILSARLIADARSSLVEILPKLSPGHPLWESVVPISCLKPSRNPGISSQRTENIPFILNELPRFSVHFLNLILNQELWDAAKQILQSESIIYHFSNVTRKPAYLGPNLSWHRDYPNEYICPEDSNCFFRALIPLEAMSEDNGCTEIIPNTHVVSDAFAQEAKRSQIIDFNTTETIPLCGQPGDMIAIHPKIVHGGRENRSNYDRNLVVIQFGRPATRYIWQCPELYSGFTREEMCEQGAAATPSHHTPLSSEG